MSLKHTCDLKTGSSGSSLWDVASGKIVGINWGGIKDRANPDSAYNAATGSEYVLKFLGKEIKNGMDQTKNATTMQTGRTTANDPKKSKKKDFMGVSCGIIGRYVESISIIFFLLPLLFLVTYGRPKKQ